MNQTAHHDGIDVFIGVDVGKGEYHVVALDQSGKRLFDAALPNDEAKLRALLAEFKAHGRPLLIVDQPATIGALPVTMARAQGVEVAYLPGLAMRRVADLHAGEAKTDARDAAIIAEAARSMPHALRALPKTDEALAQLMLLCGFDDDLASESTHTPIQTALKILRFSGSITIEWNKPGFRSEVPCFRSKVMPRHKIRRLQNQS